MYGATRREQELMAMSICLGQQVRMEYQIKARWEGGAPMSGSQNSAPPAFRDHPWRRGGRRGTGANSRAIQRCTGWWRSRDRSMVTSARGKPIRAHLEADVPLANGMLAARAGDLSLSQTMPARYRNRGSFRHELRTHRYFYQNRYNRWFRYRTFFMIIAICTD